MPAPHRPELRVRAVELASPRPRYKPAAHTKAQASEANGEPRNTLLPVQTRSFKPS